MHSGFAIVLLFLICFSGVKSEGVRWLMFGDLFNGVDYKPPGVYTKEMYFSVSTRMDISYNTEDHRKINCIIAASTNMKGKVSIIDGGINKEHLKVSYMTDNGEPDTFFLLIQSANEDTAYIKDDFARNSRYGIAYAPIKNWTQAQDALRDIDSEVIVL